MGWTAPRDWTTGEVVTEAMMDTHVKNNLRYLKGLDGVPTIESGLIIDNTGGDEYLQIPSLTTVERDALTPVNGMVIYNETTTEFNKYEAGAWVDLASGTDHGGLDGLADDDHTQYQKENLLTTAGDLAYATAASTWARLGIGTAGQFLKTNDATTAPEWAAPPATGIAVWGGDNSITAATGVTRYAFGYANAGTEMPNSENNRSFILCPRAATIKNLYVYAFTAPAAGQPLVITVRKNAGATALTATLAALGTTANDTVNSFSVVAGDRLSVSVYSASVQDNLVPLVISFEV